MLSVYMLFFLLRIIRIACVSTVQCSYTHTRHHCGYITHQHSCAAVYLHKRLMCLLGVCTSPARGIWLCERQHGVWIYTVHPKLGVVVFFQRRMQTLCVDLHQYLVVFSDDSCARLACTLHQSEMCACVNDNMASGFIHSISRLGLGVFFQRRMQPLCMDLHQGLVVFETTRVLAWRVHFTILRCALI